MTKPEVILDGTDLTALLAEDGLQFTAEKIWSQNAGRSTSTGEFSGDLIAVKYTVTLSFNRLRESEFRSIWNIVSGLTAFHTLRFPVPNGNANYMVIRCYSVSPTGKLRKWRKTEGETIYDGFTLECVGK